MNKKFITFILGTTIISTSNITPAKSQPTQKDHDLCLSSANYSNCINDRISNKAVRDRCINAADYVGCMKFNSRNKSNNNSYSNRVKRSYLNSSDRGLAPNSTDSFEKGFYMHAAVGAGKYSDIDTYYINSASEFSPGLALGVGVGYDYGERWRTELRFNRQSSDLDKVLGVDASGQNTFSTIALVQYFDFRAGKKWEPFIGVGIGRTNGTAGTACAAGTCADGASENFTSFPLTWGLNYNIRDNQSVTFENYGEIYPEISYGGGTISNSYTGSLQVGYKYRFN